MKTRLKFCFLTSLTRYLQFPPLDFLSLPPAKCYSPGSPQAFYAFHSKLSLFSLSQDSNYSIYTGDYLCLDFWFQILYKAPGSHFQLPTLHHQSLTLAPKIEHLPYPTISSPPSTTIWSPSFAPYPGLWNHHPPNCP